MIRVGPDLWSKYETALKSAGMQLCTARYVQYLSVPDV